MQFKLGEDREYLKWLAEVKEKIRTSQLNAILKVNQEMLRLYWEIGQALDEKLLHSEWGDKVIPQLAKDLGMEFQGSGFGTTQLKYFRRWYQFYASVGQQPVDQLQKERVTVFPGILGRIPWGHHVKIFTKAKTVAEALFPEA
jgi:hypothetical protein